MSAAQNDLTLVTNPPNVPDQVTGDVTLASYSAALLAGPTASAIITQATVNVSRQPVPWAACQSHAGKCKTGASAHIPRGGRRMGAREHNATALTRRGSPAHSGGRRVRR
jgi:hypothetical protein